MREAVVRCVYCGHEYPPGTPPSGDQVSALTDHIRQCEKHPMRKVEEDNAKLRRALAGLAGLLTPEDESNDLALLAAMEATIRALPVSDEGRMHTINALHALRDTARVKTEATNAP